MAGEIIRRGSGTPLPAHARREITRVAAETKVQQAVVRAKSAVGEFALSEVSYLKSVQRQTEQSNPDAADAIALIVNTTIAGIARSVAQFSAEID